jgi:hypothetical protein
MIDRICCTVLLRVLRMYFLVSFWFKSTPPPPGVRCPQSLVLPMASTLGSELHRQPFRWDQRLYAVLLQLPQAPPSVSGTNGTGPPGVPGLGFGV